MRDSGVSGGWWKVVVCMVLDLRTFGGREIACLAFWRSRGRPEGVRQLLVREAGKSFVVLSTHCVVM